MKALHRAGDVLHQMTGALPVICKDGTGVYVPVDIPSWLALLVWNGLTWVGIIGVWTSRDDVWDLLATACVWPWVWALVRWRLTISACRAVLRNRAALDPMAAWARRVSSSVGGDGAHGSEGRAPVTSSEPTEEVPSQGEEDVIVIKSVKTSRVVFDPAAFSGSH